MAATLYAVPASHPCAAVEKALQLKGVEYRRVDIPPVAHKAVQYAAVRRARPCPGCVLDGEKLLGSRKIMRALDERVPEPPLLPADEKERKSVGLAEEWGDEVLQPIVRRAIWVALRRSPASLPSYGEGSRLPIPDAVTRLTAPLVARAEQRINAATELNVRADLRALDHHLARVERWMDHDVVGGSQPNAADLQIGAGLALLLTIEDIANVFGDAARVRAGAAVVPGLSGARAGGGAPGGVVRAGERQRRLGRGGSGPPRRRTVLPRGRYATPGQDACRRGGPNPLPTQPPFPSPGRLVAAAPSGAPRRRRRSAASASAADDPSGSLTSGSTSSSGTSTNRRAVTCACGSVSRSDANATSPSSSTSTSIGRGPCRTPPASRPS